jgi:hypothetical protein
MEKKWYNILPWIALFSGILVVALLAIAIVFKPQRNFENTVNRKIAFDKVKQINIESKEMLNSKAFFNYIDKTLNCPVISTIWIITEKGEIIYAKGAMAASTPVHESIYNLIDNQNRGLIDAVEESINTIQKKVMIVAAAIRREGDHNDVYGHLVMPLKSDFNELAGFIGVAYSLDDSKPPFQIYMIGVALFISFIIYWLSIPVWVYYDSRKNNDKYIFWTLFVLIGNLPAYIAYLITRK